MKIASSKHKGRRLQQLVVSKLKELFKFHPNDVKSVPGGVQGEDIWLSQAARRKFPYSIECKNQEQFKTIYKYMGQAESNCGTYIPLLVIKSNHKQPLVILDLDNFLEMVK